MNKIQLLMFSMMFLSVAGVLMVAPLTRALVRWF